MLRRAFLAGLFGLVVTAPLAAQPAPQEPQRRQRRPRDPDAPRRPRRRRDPTRPPSAAQMAARERMRQCGADWRAARAAGQTQGRTWREFSSACLRRLRGARAA